MPKVCLMPTASKLLRLSNWRVTRIKWTTSNSLITISKFRISTLTIQATSLLTKGKTPSPIQDVENSGEHSCIKKNQIM